ncbi:MAG: nucleotidyltransferase family protein [Thermomicrobiales bacterium]
MAEFIPTTTLPPIIQRHLPEIVELARSYGVARLEVFGSVMTDRYNPLTSDVDFLVAFHPVSAFQDFQRYLALKDDLRFLVKSPLDLVMSSALNDGRFRQEANKTRQVIYDATTND